MSVRILLMFSIITVGFRIVGYVMNQLIEAQLTKGGVNQMHMPGIQRRGDFQCTEQRLCDQKKADQ